MLLILITKKKLLFNNLIEEFNKNVKYVIVKCINEDNISENISFWQLINLIIKL